MHWHLVVHYLDLFRHDNAYAWNWLTWIGNVTAGIVIFVTMTICWPKFRHFVERAIGIKGLHDKLDAHHKERTEQAERHHKAAMALARQHHFEHLSALKPATNGRDARGRFVSGLKK